MPDALNQLTPTPPQQPEEISHLKQIRTFEGDVAETIKRQSESVVSMAEAEQARRDAIRVLGPQDVEARQGSKALIYLGLTLLLLALGATGIWYAYKTYTEKSALPTVETPANQFISTESLVNVDASTLSRQTLLVAINAERAKSRGASAIEQVELRRGALPASELLTTEDFLTRLGSHAPAPLVRAFGPLFMLGLLGDPSHTFLLVNLASFESAFPGMLNWESRLSEDLLPLFASEGVAANVPTNTEWSDVTLSNRDARILKDPTGHTVLLYAFYENKMLIMTDNEDTFRTIVNRLQSEKLSR
ncbi:hypothetical protein KW800_01060 [Candidatus Parcubacteria bacterium]|nr:hypothetical protein [Candidatus Parcubacteria bacterium]